MKGGSKMHIKGLAVTLGVGAAIGAVAVMMMPKSNPTRKLAVKAAQKVEDAAWKISDKLSDEWNF
jgi:gas vesicle protein